MKRRKSAEELRLDLLDEYKVTLESDGEVTSERDQIYFDKDVELDYRDEGPDAWATSKYFEGPAWTWDADRGWELWENGVKITGYNGLNLTVVNIQKDGVHITKCTA